MMNAELSFLELTGLFPAAFQVTLAFNVELCGPGEERNVQCLRTLRLFPLEGFAFATKQDEHNALWLLNWMHYAHRGCGMDTAFRPPLVVIDGPPMCGKTTLLKRLAEIAEVTLEYVEGRPRILEKPLMVYDNISRGKVELMQLEMLGMLTAETWQRQRLRKEERMTICLRTILVMTGVGLELPPELQRRAMFVRLKAHAEA